MTTLTRFTEDKVNALLGALVFLFTLAIYTITLTPNTPFWDGGEYIATSYILGVPHAPGTPLYVLIGRLFSLIPIGEVAQRVNWLSAISSSIAVLFVYLIAVKVSRNIFPLEKDRHHRLLPYVAGTIGALFAAFATTFWDNAIEAEVYASSCALMAFVIWLALRWQDRLDEGSEDGLLLVVTYLVGLGVGIHLGVAIAAWAVVVLVFMCRPQYLRRWEYLGWALVTLSMATGIHKPAFMVAPAVLVITLGWWLVSGKLRRLALFASLLFMVGVSVHFFLIIRSNLDPMINEAAPKTWTDLWKTLIRDQYKPPSPTEFPRKAPLTYQMDFMWLRYMWWNFSLLGHKFGENYGGARDFLTGFLQPGILLTLAGAAIHFLRARRTAVILGILFVLLGPAMAFYLNFRVGEVRERDYFFVQNFMFMAIWTGIGAAWLIDWARRWVREERGQRLILWGAATLLVVVSLMPLKSNWESHDRRGFLVANNYAYNMLAGLEPDAMIFTNGDNDTFPLWYLQEVEGFRKDVRVVNLSLLNTRWYMKQLRDLEPRVPLPFTDEQIAKIRPVRDASGRGWAIKDLAVFSILKQNRWEKPVYLAVTVPDQMGLTDQLSMEGLVFRVSQEKVPPMDLEKTLHNLNEVYKYDGLVVRDPNHANGFGVYNHSVYKDSNARKLTQNYAAAFAKAALELYQRDRGEEALLMLKRAAAVSPDFPGSWITPGVILEQMGRLDEAWDHYSEMVAKHPQEWQLHFRMGEVKGLMGKMAESIPYYERAIQLAPADQYYPYQGLAGVYFQLNLYERAAEVLERWLILHPNDPNVRPTYEELRESLRLEPRSGETPGSGSGDTAVSVRDGN